ncbi:MAG: hypothetical protein KID04_11905 [Clostridium sp.]|jgi:hypothetical protein|nr:hypothetical protein [Clostridium sp.]
MDKKDFPDILYTSLEKMGGRAKSIEVYQYIWGKYENELRKSGPLFYLWQCETRKAVILLRKQGRMKPYMPAFKDIWEIQ